MASSRSNSPRLWATAMTAAAIPLVTEKDKDNVCSVQGFRVWMQRYPPHKSTTFTPRWKIVQAAPCSPRSMKFRSNAVRTRSNSGVTLPLIDGRSNGFWDTWKLSIEMDKLVEKHRGANRSKPVSWWQYQCQSSSGGETQANCKVTLSQKIPKN